MILSPEEDHLQDETDHRLSEAQRKTQKKTQRKTQKKTQKKIQRKTQNFERSDVNDHSVIKQLH